MSYSFALIDQQLSIRLGHGLSVVKPGRVTVVETPRRLVAEGYFSYIRALWWMWLTDGRSILSVPPGAGAEITALVAGIDDPRSLQDPALVTALRASVDHALCNASLPVTNRVLTDCCFACNADLLKRHPCDDCSRLTDVTMPHADDLWWPTLCIEESVAYGVMADEMVVAIAYAHKTAVMSNQVADVAVCTAEPYRRRGYARTAIAALAEHFTGTGGEARYTCDITNAPSIATAHSVGFVAYAMSLLMLARLPEMEK